MTKPDAKPENVVIRASAGTGKTFQLTNRFIRLLLAGVSPDEILATTFTRKAGGEIFDRVLQRLADAADSKQTCAQLADVVGVKELSCAQCLALLASLIQELDSLRIVTIDSFFNRLALSCSFELGLPFGWRIADEDVDRQMQSLAIQALLQNGDQQSLIALLRWLAKGNAERAVNEGILELVAALHSVFRETNKEAWHSLPRNKPLDSDELAEATARLRQLDLPSALENARATACENIQNADWEEFLCKGVAKSILSGQPKFGRTPIPPAVRTVYEPLIEHAKTVLISQLADQTEATFKMLDQFDLEYQQFKCTHRAFRFDDVTHALAFKRFPVKYDETIRLGCQINHLLLDEFQDTSLLQWQVLRPFVRRITLTRSNAELPVSSSLFCVGDVKQAIYGWRGGVAEIFDALEQEIASLRTQTLAQSYRSSSIIVETVNKVFSSIQQNVALERHRSAATAWAKGFENHTTARTLPGYARLVSAPAEGEDSSQDEKTLEFAAQEIKRLAAEAPGHSIGVLMRSNRHISTLMSKLAKLGVPASEEGGNLLSHSAAVSALLSLFIMTDHPGDRTSRFHVAKSPVGKIIGLTRFDSELLAAEVARSIRQRLLNEGYGPTTLSWVEKLAGHCTQRDLNRLLKLVELAYRYEDLASLRVRDFVSFVDAQKVEDPSATQVRVMTIHKSKGLEFDVVVLPDLSSPFMGPTPMVITGQPKATEPIDVVCRYPKKDIRQLLPEKFQRACVQNDERTVRESLCVLYVALTRGIHALHMIIPPSTERENSMPSTFAGMLRAPLTNGGFVDPGKLLYEHGDKHWFEKMSRQPEPLPEKRQSELKPVDLNLKPSSGRRTRALGLRTPSGSQGGSIVRLSERLRLGDSGALNRGALIHAWLETIEWLDENAPSDTALREVARRIGQFDNLDGLIKDFRCIIAKPEVRAVLSRNPIKSAAASLLDFTESLEVWRERPFAVREGDSLLRGAFDRVVITCHDNVPIQAEIVDFKTDAVSPEPEAIDELIEFYRPQINAYRFALATLTGLSKKDITARLLFTSIGKVRDVAAE